MEEEYTRQKEQWIKDSERGMRQKQYDCWAENGLGNGLRRLRVRVEAGKTVETTAPVQARDGGHLN